MEIPQEDFIRGELFQQIADNNMHVYYCHTHDVNDFFATVHADHQFILISHNSDGKITDKPGPTNAGHIKPTGESYDADICKMPSNLFKWYGQNVAYVSDKIIPIPIGLENKYNFPIYER